MRNRGRPTSRQGQGIAHNIRAQKMTIAVVTLRCLPWSVAASFARIPADMHGDRGQQHRRFVFDAKKRATGLRIVSLNV